MDNEIEKRTTELEKRIASLEGRIAEIEANMARYVAIPWIYPTTPPAPQGGAIFEANRKAIIAQQLAYQPQFKSMQKPDAQELASWGRNVQ